MRIFLLFVSALRLSSCAASLKAQSSGSIGCSPNEVEVSNHQHVMWGSVDSWIAQCNGKRYFCSSSGGTSVSCKEAVK